MKSLLKQLAPWIISLSVLFGGVYFASSATGASFTPVQCAQTTLTGAGIGTTDVTILLTALKSPAGATLTMTNFGTIGYMVLEPNTNAKLENISFTGIIQNAGGTATLTGVTRGIDFVSAFTSSTTLEHAHAGGSYAICSNPAVFYSQFPTLGNNNTFTGQNTFTNFPITPNNATSSVNVAGISQLATPAQQAAGTATSTNGTVAPLVLSSQYATSTWNSASLASNQTIIAGASGKIDNNFIATSTLLTNVGGANSNFGNNFYINTSPGSITGAGTGSTTVFTQTISANSLLTGNYYKTMLYFKGWRFIQGTCLLNIEVGYGGATTTIGSNELMGWFPQGIGKIGITLAAAGATNSQKLIVDTFTESTSSQSQIKVASSTMNMLNTSIDSTKAQGLTVIANTNGGGSGLCFFDPYIVTSELYN